MKDNIKVSVKVATVEFVAQRKDGSFVEDTITGQYTEKRAHVQIAREFGYKTVIIKSYEVSTPITYLVPLSLITACEKVENKEPEF